MKVTNKYAPLAEPDKEPGQKKKAKKHTPSESVYRPIGLPPQKKKKKSGKNTKEPRKTDSPVSPTTTSIPVPEPTPVQQELFSEDEFPELSSSNSVVGPTPPLSPTYAQAASPVALKDEVRADLQVAAGWQAASEISIPVRLPVVVAPPQPSIDNGARKKLFIDESAALPPPAFRGGMYMFETFRAESDKCVNQDSESDTEVPPKAREVAMSSDVTLGSMKAATEKKYCAEEVLYSHILFTDSSYASTPQTNDQHPDDREPPTIKMTDQLDGGLSHSTEATMTKECDAREVLNPHIYFSDSCNLSTPKRNDQYPDDCKPSTSKRIKSITQPKKTLGQMLKEEMQDGKASNGSRSPISERSSESENDFIDDAHMVTFPRKSHLI